MKLTPLQEDIINAKICPYCKTFVKTISETDVYGKEYKGRKVIACKNYPYCDSYVGTHDDGTALGRLANKELRNAKKQAHYWFDKIWKDKHLKRSEAYKWLSEKLNLPSKYTHIGMFSVKTCNDVIFYSKQVLKDISQIDKDFGIQ